MKNKIIKYFKYAVGEVLLVVFGILIAVQINNWNEIHKAKKHLNEIYIQIQKDLTADTLKVSEFIAYYDEKNKRIQDILDDKIEPSFYDTITENNYKNCDICRCEATGYGVFSPQLRGFNLLTKSNVTNAVTNDSLPDLLTDFYEYLPNIERQVEKIDNLVAENIAYYMKYSWYTDWGEDKYNKDFLIFIFESEDYRKIIMRYRIAVIYNYLRDLKYYKAEATRLLYQLELRIDKE